MALTSRPPLSGPPGSEPITRMTVSATPAATAVSHSRNDACTSLGTPGSAPNLNADAPAAVPPDVLPAPFGGLLGDNRCSLISGSTPSLVFLPRVRPHQAAENSLRATIPATINAIGTSLTGVAGSPARTIPRTTV